MQLSYAHIKLTFRRSQYILQIQNKHCLCRHGIHHLQAALR